MRDQAGRTLISLVMVVIIIAVLAVAVFVVIDPMAQVGNARNEVRRQDVGIIATAFSNYSRDHRGALPIYGVITTATKKVVCTATSSISLTCGADTDKCLKIHDDTFWRDYLAALPSDPGKSSTTVGLDTGYYLKKDSSTGQLIVGACDTYNSAVITKTTATKVICDLYDNGYCMVIDSDGSGTCDDICNAQSMKCVANPIRKLSGCSTTASGADNYCCRTAESFSQSCSVSCLAAADTFTDSAWVGLGICYYQTGNAACDTDNASTKEICACQ